LIIAIAVLAVASVIININIKASSVNILYDDCEPQIYYAVCHGIYPNTSTAFNDANAAYFIGDFKSVAAICSTMLKDKLNKILKLNCLNLLASSAFLSGDFELCREICDQARAHMSSLKLKQENKSFYSARYDFFLNFINCDYAAALKNLEVCKGTCVSKQKNSYKLIMCYHTAVTLYYSNKTEEAKAQFEKITAAAPNFFILEKSQLYLNAIENNTFVPIDSISLREAYENGMQSPPKPINKRKQIASIIILLVLVSVCIYNVLQIPGIERGSAYEVISSDYEVNEICETIALDDDYSLCIFTTPYDEIGVAYLKNCGDNEYSYCISYIAEPEIYSEQDNGYFIYASGKTPRVYFDITDDKAAAPPNSSITEFTYNNDVYYFYIFDTEVKYNLGNASGVNIK
ncbi:MAG: hypothetical protein ACI4RF_02405, partial [Eubacterium sp.]